MAEIKNINNFNKLWTPFSVYSFKVCWQHNEMTVDQKIIALFFEHIYI